MNQKDHKGKVSNYSSVSRIWDKVLGGSCKILVFVAVAMLLTLKRILMQHKTAGEMKRILIAVG